MHASDRKLLHRALGMETSDSRPAKNAYWALPSDEEFGALSFLANEGLMKDHGEQKHFDGNHFFTVTEKGMLSAFGGF